MSSIKHYQIVCWSEQKRDWVPTCHPIQKNGVEAARTYAEENIRFGTAWELRPAN